MTTAAEWASRVAGDRCPLDTPRPGHIIPRYVGDPKWGAPIWQVPLDTMPDYRLAEAERSALIATLREALTAAHSV